MKTGARGWLATMVGQLAVANHTNGKTGDSNKGSNLFVQVRRILLKMIDPLRVRISLGWLAVANRPTIAANHRGDRR